MSHKIDKDKKTEDMPTVETMVDGVTEDLIAQDESERQAEEIVDLKQLVPKKPDWDLKRALEPNVEKLERRTKIAIVELIRTYFDS